MSVLACIHHRLRVTESIANEKSEIYTRSVSFFSISLLSFHPVHLTVIIRLTLRIAIVHFPLTPEIVGCPVFMHPNASI